MLNKRSFQANHNYSSGIVFPSEFAEYLALSFYGVLSDKEPYGNKLEVFNLKTGEVVASMDKDNDLRYAEITVTEPDGNVVAIYKGKSFKVC